MIYIRRVLIQGYVDFRLTDPESYEPFFHPHLILTDLEKFILFY